MTPFPNHLRRLVIALGMAGTLLFSLALAVSFTRPEWVEKIGKDIIRHQVEKKVHEKVEALDARFLTQKAVGLIKDHDARIAQTKHALANGLPERIARVVAEMTNLDCECRKKIEQVIHAGYLSQLADATQAKARLDTLIRTKYMQTVDQLLREFRIVTGSNAVVFGLLAVAGLARKKASLHLIPATLVLLGAAGITAFLYLFNQDWLHTVVFGDYVGFGYAAYLLLAVALLGDVLCNRARITSEILTQCFSSLGNGLVVTPC